MKLRMLTTITALFIAGATASPALAQNRDTREPMGVSSEASADTSDTALANQSLRANDVSTFDVLGFKLGMAPREITRVARQVNMVRKYRRPALTNTFEALATMEANRTLSQPLPVPAGQVIIHEVGITPDGSHMEINFYATPDGSRASYYKYSTKPNGQTRDQLKQTIIAKYGKPDWDMGDQMFWCGGVPECRNVPEGNDRMKVYMSDDVVTFTLRRADNYGKKMEQALKDRAKAIAAGASKPMAF